MSTDYYMVCHECQHAIHVAQDGLSGFTFYSGEPRCMKALGDFMKAHSLHAKSIRFEPEQDVDEDFIEVPWHFPGPP